MMNISAWKLLLAASCMTLSSLSFSAPVDATPAVAAGTKSHTTHALRNPLHNPPAIARVAPATQPLHTTGGESATFRYIDAVPARNPRHIHAAVMSFVQSASKKNQCGAMTGSARQHCFELMMPT